MKRSSLFAASFALIAPTLIFVSGCRGGAAKEVAEEVVAEALVTQAISGYNEVALSVSVNDASVNMSCSTSGTLDWSELDSNNQICYQTDSRGCSFTTGNGRSFTISGTSEMCGSDDFAVTEGAVYSGQSFTLKGNATVTSGNASRTCDYELQVSSDSVTSDGKTYDVQVTGSVCGRPGFSASFDIAVEGNVEVESTSE